MKNILIGVAIAAVAATVFANQQTSQCGGCAEGNGKPVVAETKSQGACCQEGKAVAASQTEKACCQEGKAVVAEKAEKACCQSTEGKTVMKGEKGCCNAPTELAKFKVFADGKYHFFGCEESASQGRKSLMASAKRVGSVQKVTSRIRINGTVA